MHSIFLKLLVLILVSSCVSSTSRKKEGLFQHVTKDAYLVKFTPAPTYNDGQRIVTAKTHFIDIVFEQSREPVYGIPKWTDQCLKENKSGKIKYDEEKMYSVSEVYIHYNGSIGHCESAPHVFKAHYVVVYCPIYKEVIEYKFSYDPSLNFEDIDLCK